MGNPRRHLLAEPLSAASLEKAAACSASLALAVLTPAVPKFCIQEAQALGVSIRWARDRGEEVADAARSFARLLAAIQDQNLPTAAQRLVETAHRGSDPASSHASSALAPGGGGDPARSSEPRPSAPADQGKARDASSAARLMTQVRAAISEDRRDGTPEEEIEQLWREVDRLTQEKKRGSATVTTPRGEGTPGAAAEPEPGEPEPTRMYHSSWSVPRPVRAARGPTGRARSGGGGRPYLDRSRAEPPPTAGVILIQTYRKWFIPLVARGRPPQESRMSGTCWRSRPPADLTVRATGPEVVAEGTLVSDVRGVVRGQVVRVFGPLFVRT